MIMELPKEFSIGDKRQKNDAYIEDGILKIRKTASFRYVIYEIAYILTEGKHKCGYCGITSMDRKMTMDHMYPQDMGGPTITNNLLPSCKDCNSKKTDMTKEEYEFFKCIESNEVRKKFLRELRIEKEKMKKNQKYQIPKEWISEKEITSLLVQVNLGDCTQTNKYKKVKEFYERYSYFPKPILIDKNGFLLDGFYSVMYAKNHLITTIPAIQLENVEIIF